MTLHWRGVLGPRFRIASVRLQGLQVTLPPRRNAGPSSDEKRALDLPSGFPVLIDRIEATDAQITVLRAQPEKPPLLFQLHRLQMENVSFDAPAEFEATLTNAVPRGEIHVLGVAGPWDRETPRSTPVRATYQFLAADLSTINGLRGTLSSFGTITGPLDCLEVQGSTDTPDFTLRRVANPTFD